MPPIIAVTTEDRGLVDVRGQIVEVEGGEGGEGEEVVEGVVEASRE